MTSTKVKIDNVSKNERTFSSPTDKAVTKMRDKVITSIEITKRSGVPTLFFSNPGYGKTTTINSYARMSGMHVEELIGSQYSQDEILGFQSRTDKSYLEILEPEWYHRIVTYAEPHYEKISSGSLFTLVEESDVDNWNKLLQKAINDEAEINTEIESLKARVCDTDENAQTVIRTHENELERVRSKISKYKALLDDVEWRQPRASILFLDELSTATPNVQGAILNLVFNRKIRGNKELPKDTIILSAANYKANLTGYNEIISPQLNRFCIVNLLPGNKNSDPRKSSYENIGLDLVGEFLQDFQETDIPLPTFRQDFTFNQSTNQHFLEDLRTELANIIHKYSSLDSSRVMLNFRNINFDGIYDRDDDVPEVYNFMSPRTFSYYARIVRAMCEMGITITQKDIYESIVDGIFGLGTNTIQESGSESFLAVLNDFHRSLYDMTATLLAKYKNNVSDEKHIDKKDNQINATDSLLGDIKTITGKVKKIISMDEHNEFQMSDEIVMSTLNQIVDEMSLPSPSIYISQMKDICAKPEKVIQFRSDYESMKQLLEVFQKYNKYDMLNALIFRLDELISDLKFYYNELANITN